MLIVLFVFWRGITPYYWCRPNGQHQMWAGEIECFFDCPCLHQNIWHTDKSYTKNYNVATVETFFLHQTFPLTAFFDTRKRQPCQKCRVTIFWEKNRCRLGAAQPYWLCWSRLWKKFFKFKTINKLNNFHWREDRESVEKVSLVNDKN